MDIVALLTRPGTYVLGLAIFIAAFFTRRIVETAMPWWKKKADANDEDITYPTRMSRWWNEVILYGVPVVFGCLAGLIPSQFFFEGIEDHGARVLFSGAVGWFASFFYKLVRKIIKQKTGLDPIPSMDSIRPDAPAGD